MILSVPEKHVVALLNGVKAVSADAGRQETEVGAALTALRVKITAAKPNVARRRIVEVDLQARFALMLAVDHVAEKTTASTKHWAEKARGKLVQIDPADSSRLVL